MSERICFVIQPFNETFDKRYKDVYYPAIRKAGLTPYRVDLDPSAKNLIENIEEKIQESEICLADISIDNPNVWYELGYAFALSKDVVMICDNNRKNFPFDVSHKSIIPYKIDSLSDFTELTAKITEKILAYIQNVNSVKTSLLNIQLQDIQGLQPFEYTVLAIIIGEQKTDNQSVALYNISQGMDKAGFTETATSIGIRLLRRKGLIENLIDQDWNGNEFDAIRLTESGEEFILTHIDMFELRKKIEVVPLPPPKIDYDDELPF